MEEKIPRNPRDTEEEQDHERKKERKELSQVVRSTESVTSSNRLSRDAGRCNAPFPGVYGTVRRGIHLSSGCSPYSQEFNS